MEETLRDRVKRLRLDRRLLAIRLGMAYGTIGSRLSGFTRFTPEEERSLVEILNLAEESQRDFQARLEARETPYHAK